MEYLPYIFFLVISALTLLVIRIWLNKVEKSSKISDELSLYLREVSESSKLVDQKLTQNMQMFNSRLDKAAQAMMGVQKSIGEFSEIGRSMHKLQEFLQSPKLRGNIGEQVLKELLSQSLPLEVYDLQYQFKDGQRVDAVIRTTQGIIPIDSKFPLSSFKKIIDEENLSEKEKNKKEFVRDVKKHIESISQKYIRTSEGTLDYALMYIPSESVYYEIINSADIYDFASEKRIVPVSPMSFYAYLKVILVSHEGQRIEKRAKSILSTLHSMKKDYEKLENSFSIMSKHVGNAYNQSSNTMLYITKLGQKIDSTSELQEPEIKKIEK